MAIEFISPTIRTYVARRFKDTFTERNSYDTGFIFVGRSLEWETTPNVDSISFSVKSEKEIWDNMIALKMINAGDLELAIPRYNWVSGRKYKQFDDIVPLNQLVEIDNINNLYPMYVVNSELNVYKCVNNNNGSVSIEEPIGNYTVSNGFIKTGSDGYVWKYLFNIKESNKFLNDEWIPVPYSVDVDVVSTDYDMKESTLIDGSLSLIVVENSGNGYFHTSHTNPFTNNQTQLSVTDTTNIVVDMLVSGNGIPDGTYITSVSTEQKTITLSRPTTASGNSFTITTRVVVEGDGTGISVTPVLKDDTLEKIIVDSDGVNYTKANVFIYGSTTGNNATARAVLPLKFGHGYSPALELLSTNLIYVTRIGQVDSSENGLIPTDISYRQYGLLINPHKYNSDMDITYTTANTVLSQTTDITVAFGDLYTQNEFVYQGDISNPTFQGFVVSQTPSVVKLIKTFGTPDIGKLLKGSTVSRPVISFKNPELEPYSGDILYTKNVQPIERTNGQAEEIKFIIKF